MARRIGGAERLHEDVKKEGRFALSRKEIREWLMKQDAYTLHKPMRRHFKRNRAIVGGIDQQWQMDLADMQSMQKFNDGYRYLLVCIDVFSKYAWVVPLKNKTGPALVEAFKVILTSGRKPEKIMTDQGTEFLIKQTFPSGDERRRHRTVQYVQWNESFYRGTSDSYFKNQNVALFYGQENHAIRRHVTRAGLFLQP
jgi:hypothetical protein